MPTKTCTKCKQEKDVIFFQKYNRSKDGYSYRCKECLSRRSDIKKEKERIKKELFLIGLKKCVKCNIIKSVNEFSSEKKALDKLRSFCHECDREQSKKYRNNPINKEKIKESCKKQNKRYRENNREKLRISSREYQRVWRKEYRKRDYVKQYERDYKRKHCKEYRKRKLQNDFYFKLKMRLRDRVRMALKNCGGKKSYKTMELLGCDITFLKYYLESLWADGMSWDNYGLNGWHIDHIKPCNAFDLTDPQQQKECFHYTNLQPLWRFDNLSKGCKF
jgi:hypothetical protein